MSNFRILSVAATLFAAALVPVTSAHADTFVTYNFTYSGTGTHTAGETASGNGSITFDVSFIGAGNLSNISAFNFTDTLVAGADGSSTFTYGLADLASSSEQFAGPLSSPTLININLTTLYKAGTANTNFSNTRFALQYNSATNDSTSGVNGLKLDDFTSGGGTMTLAPFIPNGGAAAPEPSSLLLLGTGLAGAGMLFARRRNATQASSL